MTRVVALVQVEVEERDLKNEKISAERESIPPAGFDRPGQA